MTVPRASALNFATNTRWIASIPFYQIDSTLKTQDVAFNLTTFSIPEMTVGTTEIMYQGYPVEVLKNKE